MHVESVFLSVEGGDFEAFPVSLSLLPYTASHLLALSGVPRAPGTVSSHQLWGLEQIFPPCFYRSETPKAKGAIACYNDIHHFESLALLAHSSPRLRKPVLAWTGRKVTAIPSC